MELDLGSVIVDHIRDTLNLFDGQELLELSRDRSSVIDEVSGDVVSLVGSDTFDVTIGLAGSGSVLSSVTNDPLTILDHVEGDTVRTIVLEFHALEQRNLIDEVLVEDDGVPLSLRSLERSPADNGVGAVVEVLGRILDGSLRLVETGRDLEDSLTGEDTEGTAGRDELLLVGPVIEDGVVNPQALVEQEVLKLIDLGQFLLALSLVGVDELDDQVSLFDIGFC